MKTSHTPGPWVMRNTGTSVAVFGRNGTEQIHCERNTPQDEANARLIAAAPELLEMLQAVVGLLERHVIIPVDQETGEIKETHRIYGKDLIRVEMARAAIAKATQL